MSQFVDDLCPGAVAGFIATTPMTLTMDLLHPALPRDEQDPLPPRITTERVLETVGARDALTDDQRHDLTMLAHFGYGATVGALYPPLARELNLPPVAGGIAYALGVWACSYLGWLPATGLYRPPHREPAGRHAVTVAGHVVWGATLGLMTAMMDPSARGGANGRLRGPNPTDAVRPPLGVATTGS